MRIKISEENVQSLLPAALMSPPKLNSVRDACAEFLKNQLHPSNCLGIPAFADAHIGSELLEPLRVASPPRRFVEVSQTEELLQPEVNPQIHVACASYEEYPFYEGGRDNFQL